MAIGQIEGALPGSRFETRQALHTEGVHRATQAGITGTAAAGAESIVLSGGYADDEDHGDVIIYTGHGGRDPNTGRQIADQEFVRGNQALVTSCLRGLPVRVIRGGGHRGGNAPRQGYRYDGLYWVESYWRERGRDGYRICRFRLANATARSSETIVDGEPGGNDGPARRVRTTIQRIVRDTALGREVKQFHGYACQVCGVALDCQGGPYAEAAHIRPLGAPHHGPDSLENLLCLCPNHHVLFDSGGFTIADDFSLTGLGGMLRLARGHVPSLEHLAYHRSLWGPD